MYDTPLPPVTMLILQQDCCILSAVQHQKEMGKLSQLAQALSHRFICLEHHVLQVDAHSVGCTAVSWSPAAPPGSLVSGKPPAHAIARFATAGCDRTVRVGLLPLQLLHLSVLTYHYSSANNIQPRPTQVAMGQFLSHCTRYDGSTACAFLYPCAAY